MTPKLSLPLLSLLLLYAPTNAYALVVDFNGFNGYDAGSLIVGANSWQFTENGYHFTVANSTDNSLTPPVNIPPANFSSEISSTSITVTSLDGGVFDINAFWIRGGIDVSSSWMEVQPQLQGQDVVLPGGGATDFYYDAWNGGHTYYYSDVPGVPSMDNPYADKTTAYLRGYDSYAFASSLGLTLQGLTIVNNNAVSSVPLPNSIWMFAAGLFGLFRLKTGSLYHRPNS